MDKLVRLSQMCLDRIDGIHGEDKRHTGTAADTMINFFAGAISAVELAGDKEFAERLRRVFVMVLAPRGPRELERIIADAAVDSSDVSD